MKPQRTIDTFAMLELLMSCSVLKVRQWQLLSMTHFLCVPVRTPSGKNGGRVKVVDPGASPRLANAGSFYQPQKFDGAF